MRLFIFFLLFIPSVLWGSDTLWVARLKPPDRTILAVFPPGFILTETGNSGKKVDIAYRMFTTASKVERWDSKANRMRLVTSNIKTAGVLDTMALKIRIYGMDTTRVEIRWTTEYDSIPENIGSGEWILNAEGKFERK